MSAGEAYTAWSKLARKCQRVKKSPELVHALIDAALTYAAKKRGR